MCLIIPSDDFKMHYLIFMEPKPNMLLEGNFTKLIYSDDKMIMNGLFLDFPIEEQKMNKHLQNYSNYMYHLSNNSINSNNYYNKNMLYFDIVENTETLHILCEIETKLLDYYSEYNSVYKRPVYILKKQLINGKIKYYREQPLQQTDSTNRRFYIKISGIWETKEEIGITYKINEYISENV